MARKQNARWFWNVFDAVAAKMQAFALMQAANISWHPNANSYFCPKFNVSLNRTEWEMFSR